MQSFQHVENPMRIFSGPDSLKGLEKELARLGASRAVILCGRTLARGPLPDLVRDGAGARCAGVWPGVRAHTPRMAVEEAANELKLLDADAVVALGGGSAVVSARAVAIFLAEGHDLDAMCTVRDATGRMTSPRLDAPKVPVIAVPTTPNTALVKAGTAVFDEAAGQRKALFDPKTRSQSVFLHPDFLMSAPRDLVASAALDTLSLAIEGLLSAQGDPVSDALLIHAVRLMAQGLPRLMSADDATLRGGLAMAGILAGRGTDHTGAGAATVLGHAIGANHHVENGIAKAVVLPHVLRFNAGHAESGLIKLSTALGLPQSTGPEPINTAFDKVYRDLGVPKRLRDLDIPQDALPAIAERSMADWFLRSNPRPVSDPAELMQILTPAW